MVAVASPVQSRAASRRRDLEWSLGAGAALIVGLGLRLVLGASATGDRSASVMAALLTLGAWLSAMLLSTPRTAFLVTLVLVAIFDLAALPPRFEPGYDSREAFYNLDQVLTAQVQASRSLAQSGSPVLTLLVEPIFPASATQPRFGLAGEVGGVRLEWDCSFQRGLQQLALPVPPTALSRETLDVRVHLTGAPSREADYLLAYASAARGGFLVSLVGAAEVDSRATACALRTPSI